MTWRTVTSSSTRPLEVSRTTASVSRWPWIAMRMGSPASSSSRTDACTGGGAMPARVAWWPSGASASISKLPFPGEVKARALPVLRGLGQVGQAEPAVAAERVGDAGDDQRHEAGRVAADDAHREREALAGRLQRVGAIEARHAVAVAVHAHGEPVGVAHVDA